MLMQALLPRTCGSLETARREKLLFGMLHLRHRIQHHMKGEEMNVDEAKKADSTRNLLYSTIK